MREKVGCRSDDVRNKGVKSDLLRGEARRGTLGKQISGKRPLSLT